MRSLIPTERVTSVMFLLRGYKVLLDADLAFLYGEKRQSRGHNL